MLDAINFSQMTPAVKQIFSALGKVRTLHYNVEYSIDRAVSLAECIARDFDTKLKKLLSVRPIMQIPFEQHKEIDAELKKLEEQWI